ncbi:MAG: MarR family transcriptional regulator [Candidatus Krumholzibacteria bacterium]|nr:MarR family transcriptional regulator [Candidatus Krumholzibacteria bacterium]MDH4336112.1 MarR family transcriptional regulator [Candidatus Krumholzibacteria bacterium]MDH5268753.1 MarR family transcriptional regulator [Candidatus Krumholzibacteria bacterium]
MTPTAPTKSRQDAALDRDARALYEALGDLVRLYQFRDRNLICCNDVSVTQCYALQALSRGGTMTLGSLARELFLDKSTASRVVETLERKGYVARSTHPDDARALEIALTARGRNLHKRIEIRLIEEERDLLAGLTPEVRRAATELIRNLARATAKRMGVSASNCCTSTGVSE